MVVFCQDQSVDSRIPSSEPWPGELVNLSWINMQTSISEFIIQSTIANEFLYNSIYKEPPQSF